MKKIRFTIYGEPAPGGSKTIGYKTDHKGAVRMSYMNTKRFGRVLRPIAFLRDAGGKRNAKWKRDVERGVLAHMQTNFLTMIPAGVPVTLRMTFYIKRAANHYGTGKNAATLNKHGRSLPYPTKDPDTTKLIRSTEDAMKGIVWYDDNQVVDQHAYKRWTKTPQHSPGCVIEIESLGEPELFGGDE